MELRTFSAPGDFSELFCILDGIFALGSAVDDDGNIGLAAQSVRSFCAGSVPHSSVDPMIWKENIHNFHAEEFNENRKLGKISVDRGSFELTKLNGRKSQCLKE